MNKVSLILVTFNRSEILEKILKTIYSFDWEYEYFVIIDNCSSDNTITILSEFQNKINNLRIIRTNTNVGHGAALAEGFAYLEKKSHSIYYILLEDDSIPKYLLLDKLIQAIDSSAFGIISSFGMKVSLGKRISITPSVNEIVDADFCLLDGAIIRSEIIKSIGLPTTDWFMMFDDYEYCYRIKKFGYRIGVIKNNFHQILHFGGGEKYSKSNLWRGYYQSRNHVFFLKKHFNLFNLLDFIILQIKRLFGASLAPDRYIRIKYRFKGIVDGIKGLKGKTLDPSSFN